MLAHMQFRLPLHERNGLFLPIAVKDFGCTTNTRLKPWLDDLVVEFVVGMILEGAVDDLSTIPRVRTRGEAGHIDLSAATINGNKEEVSLGDSLWKWKDDVHVRGNGKRHSRIERGDPSSGQGASLTESAASISVGKRYGTLVFRRLMRGIRALVDAELALLLAPCQAAHRTALVALSRHPCLALGESPSPAERAGERRFKTYLAHTSPSPSM